MKNKVDGVLEVIGRELIPLKGANIVVNNMKKLQLVPSKGVDGVKGLDAGHI